MIRYIFRKLGYGSIVLFGAVTVVFLLFNLKPGDPARMLGGQRADQAIVDAIRKDLGLDLPLYQQYLLYLNDLSPLSLHHPTNTASHIYLDDTKYNYTALLQFGDSRVLVAKTPYLRRSYQTKRKVADILMEAMPGTIILALAAILFATLFGILLGVLAAVRKDTFWDKSTLVAAVLGMSAPSFYSAMLIAWLFGNVWRTQVTFPLLPLLFMGASLGVSFLIQRRATRVDRIKATRSFYGENLFKGFVIGFGFWLVGSVINSMFDGSFIPLIDTYIHLPGTGLNMTGAFIEVDDFGAGEYIAWKNLILPALTLGIRPLAVVMQLTRNSLLEVMGQDYIRTAIAKGVSKQRVLIKHALRNALNPVVTAVSGWFASLLAGAVFVEIVFDWNGLGEKVYESLINDDFPVVIGASLLICVVFIGINFSVDIIYGLLDPRVRVATK